MLIVVAGESHSFAYRRGLHLLSQQNSLYSVNIAADPPQYISTHLRATGATWGDLNNTTGWINSYGEEDWWTSETAISRTKAGILYCHNNSLTMSAFGFGWCWVLLPVQQAARQIRYMVAIGMDGLKVPLMVINRGLEY
jgi:hypothetical protein